MEGRGRRFFYLFSFSLKLAPKAHLQETSSNEDLSIDGFLELRESKCE